MNNPNRDIIKNVFPFFEDELVSELIRVSVYKKVKEGEDILEEGNYIKSFPLVLSGCLRVSRMNDEGNELLLYYLRQGELCAMALTCCIGMQKSNIIITAIESSEILAVPVDKPEKWMGEYRTWKEFMMYSYRKRFEELLDTIDAIAFRQMDERLIRFFMELYRSTGRTVFKGTHNEIAIQLNTSREVISRLLSRLEKENKVVTRRNLIDYTNLVK
ncbi:MAG TPA: Crp/Fnr family transcriptional regulator [Bacteroidales bacterium]|nr:Crp/Fnr family transcriptional regulator [Bacteroidales bacterium]HOK75656.1 Crp/Fnr family transcriptional regulator [Bacteroidales bacterium]HOM40243.1 Crp/Fnr family transcriptional regulator [Bacteroidales bacterium]HPP92746.1 Crp/Fnr family transcriptional regulator [Bacteroidales bacterium]HRR16938.1 Crp/Fnr family transcriptional regulator [Bacteroidales bacterium]